MANNVKAQRDLRRLETRLIGVSEEIREVRALIAKVASTEATVLLQGESGTGKEVIARLVHDCSERAKGPFVPVNCGAIPGELLESELFGHEKGAFTGAIHSKQGLFESAQGGTLFLDEIGELPVTLQPKLLRALETRRARRLGGTKEYEFDFRLISATHRNLEHAISEGSFRQDLSYRLFSIEIMIPSLRERPEDIDLLAHHFLRMTARAWGKTVPGFASDTLELLRQHSWPGNVRELENVLQRALVLSSGGKIMAGDIMVDGALLEKTTSIMTTAKMQQQSANA